MTIQSICFSEVEMEVYRTGELPLGVTPESVAAMFRDVFPHGYVLANSARELWRALIISYCTLKSVKPTVAMPRSICEGMVESIAVSANFYPGVDPTVVLYDNLAELVGSQYVIYASYKAHADIIIVGNLEGRREALPQRSGNAQLIVDDACQCADGICGFREGADFGLFSFGYDKPLFAGGGGVIGACNMNGRDNSGRDLIDLCSVESLIPYRVADWRAYLMISQLVRCRNKTL